jgi:hypothetical protein
MTSIIDTILDNIDELKRWYIKQYGYDWNHDLITIFYLNCDVNLESIIENELDYIHPNSLKHGITKGIFEIIAYMDCYYTEKYGVDDICMLSYDSKTNYFNDLENMVINFIKGSVKC